MLDKDVDAGGLDACSGVAADAAGNEAILGIVLEVTSAEGRAVQVHGRSVSTTHTCQNGLMAVSHALAAGQLGVPGRCNAHSAGEPGVACKGAVGCLARAVLALLCGFTHAAYSADVPAGVSLDLDRFGQRGLFRQHIPDGKACVGVDGHIGHIAAAQLVVAAAGRLGIHDLGQVSIGLALYDIVGLIPQREVHSGCVDAVRRCSGEGHHVVALGIDGAGLGGLDTADVGLVGVIVAVGAAQVQAGLHAAVQHLVGSLVGLMLHDALHAACDIITGQIAVQHAAVACGHIVQRVLCGDLIRVSSTGTGVVVDDGLIQGDSQLCAGCVAAVGIAPLVCILLNVKLVFAALQNVAALTKVIKACQCIGVKADDHFLRLTRFQLVGLGKADQNDLGLFQTNALDAEAVGVGLIGSIHVQLYNVLAGHVTGVGDLDGDGVGAVSFQRNVAVGDLFGEGGVAQAVTEGKLHNLIVAGNAAVLEGQRFECIGIKVTHAVGGLVVTVADVDAFFVLVEGLAASVLVIIGVVEGGVCGHVVCVGVHQTAGGVVASGQQGADANDTSFARVADPQAGIDIVFLRINEAQLHGHSGVDQHDGVGEVLLAECQQGLFVLVQLQIGAAGQGIAVAVVVHGGRSALSTAAAEGHDDVIGVAVCTDGVLCAAVNARCKLVDAGVAGPAHTCGVGAVIAALAAALLCQPVPCCTVDVHASLDESVAQQNGVLVILTACRTGTAFHIVVGHSAQNGHLGALCQRQTVVLILQQDCALGLDIHADVVAFLVALICGEGLLCSTGIIIGKGYRCNTGCQHACCHAARLEKCTTRDFHNVPPVSFSLFRVVCKTHSLFSTARFALVLVLYMKFAECSTEAEQPVHYVTQIPVPEERTVPKQE